MKNLIPLQVRRPPIRGGDAVATWSLRRQWQAGSEHASASVQSVMSHAKPHDDGTFQFNGRRLRVRPSVALMLAELWKSPGRPIDVNDWCDAAYGQPVSLRAVRQTAFRCSRVMERVGCPLKVCCRGARIVVLHNESRWATVPCDDGFLDDA